MTTIFIRFLSFCVCVTDAFDFWPQTPFSSEIIVVFIVQFCRTWWSLGMHMCVCVCVYAVMQWDFIYTVGKEKKNSLYSS